MDNGLRCSYSKNNFEITNNFLIFDNVKMIIMSKTNQEFMKQTMTGSIGGDEDYLYEQYLLQEKLNEEYWESVSVSNNEEEYIPTKEEENEVIVENNQQNESEMPDLKWEEYMHPDFPWSKRSLWINNPKAVQYWMKTKGGSQREFMKIINEEQNIKNY